MSDLETLQDNRSSLRSRTFLGAKIIVKNQSTFDCLIKNRDDKGFGLKLENSQDIPDDFQLLDEKTGIKYDVAVVWRKRTMLGVKIVD